MALYDKLEDTDDQLLAGKKALADALLQVGITAVEPNPNNPDSYETFQSYADKIKRLMISNSLILEYSVSEEEFSGLTKYKRTLFLPMSGVPYNDVIIALIESDTGYTSATTLATAEHTNERAQSSPVVSDLFGNMVSDGLSEPAEPEPWEDPEFARYMLEQAATPLTLALEDMYSFTVDWGDGSPVQEFISLKETQDVWYHTYEKAGTYDVTINGVFTKLQNINNSNGWLLIDGDYVYDRDGVRCYDSCNYFNTNFLSKIIAWGNTQLSDISQGIRGCTQLKTLPTYDTTNSFLKLTTAYYFANDSALTAIPWDSGAKRGMFSNSPVLSNVSCLFRLCKSMTGAMPPYLLENCPEVYTMTLMFDRTTRITGEIPAAMYSGCTQLKEMTGMFRNCQYIGGVFQTNTFASNPVLVDLSGAFAGTAVSGVVPAQLFAHSRLSSVDIMKLSSIMALTQLTGVDKDALSGMSAGVLHMWGSFMSCLSMNMPFPDGIFSHLYSGQRLWAAGMFQECALASMTPDILDELRGVEDARCVFAGNTGMTGNVNVPSYASYDDIRNALGVFAGCSSLDNYDDIPAELGGGGNRLFPDYHVGMIALDDGSLVEINDFTYDPANKPIGFVFESTETEDKVCAFADISASFIDESKNVSLVHGMPGETAMATEEYLYGNYSGEDITRQICAWSGYTANSEHFPALRLTKEFSFGDSADREAWIPSMPELSSIFALRVWIAAAADKIIASSAGEATTSNCYGPEPFAAGSSIIYWSSQLLYSSYHMNVWSIMYHGQITRSSVTANSRVRPCCSLPK